MATSRNWYAKSVKAFAESELRRFLEAREAAVVEHVKREDEDYLLNVSEDEYNDYLGSKYSVEPLVFDFDRISATTAERPVRAEDLPSMATWNVTPGLNRTGSDGCTLRCDIEALTASRRLS